jgi:hypothetical protein
MALRDDPHHLLSLLWVVSYYGQRNCSFPRRIPKGAELNLLKLFPTIEYLPLVLPIPVRVEVSLHVDNLISRDTAPSGILRQFC